MTCFDASRARLYGLLHVTADRASHANLRPGSKDPADIYLLCSALCAASVAASGGSFALITNDGARLRDRCRALGIADLDLIQHRFKWPVPDGIAFHSAHFKLELIEAFGSGQFGECAGLIDIDTVLWQPLDLPALTRDGLVVYDITDIEVASYGPERIRHDLEVVAGRPLRDPRWYGGEFLMGTAAGFAILSQEIRKCWPNYLKAVGGLNHVGDEMIVSTAINLAVEAGLPLINADRAGGVARWWTARTNAPIPTFQQIANRSLLHLPADKEFLAGFPRNAFDSSRFVAAYRKYAARKLLLRRIVNVVSQSLGGRRGFVAQLA
jgi:hypothetical protein